MVEASIAPTISRPLVAATATKHSLHQRQHRYTIQISSMTDEYLLDCVPESPGFTKSSQRSVKDILARHVPGSRPHTKPLLPISTKLSNELRLRYYRYEVTFGLYVMTLGERLVFNGIVLLIFSAILYGLYVELRPFLVHVFCRMVYYATGLADQPDTSCTE